MPSKLLTVLIVACIAAACVAFEGAKRLSQLQREGKLKSAHEPRTALGRTKAASSSTYVTLQGYSSTSCSGTPLFQETFVTGICFQTGFSSASTLSGMYVWDSDSDILYTQFYTDSACSVLSSYTDYISDGLPPNECFFGFELMTATSMPSLPSAGGISLDGYTSSSSCSSGSNLLMEYWINDAFLTDDNFSGDDDFGFFDDATYVCEFAEIPNYDSYNEVNYTIASYVTKADTTTAPSRAPTSSPDDDSTSCFAGSETVQLEDGAVVPISSVVVGDRILAADAHGHFKFSNVIAVPHEAANTQTARFTQLVAASGKDIKMTSEHLVSVSAACDGTTTLMEAGAVASGMCLVSVDGLEKVVASKMVHGKGVHTLVTEDEMVVVNGFVASPFAHNHAAANAYYNIIRMLPTSVANSRLMKQANALFGSLVTAFSR